MLPPSGVDPGVCAVECAGWAPGKDGAQILVAREADAGGRALRRFEVYGPDLARPLRRAGEPGTPGGFPRSADAAWRGASTIAR